MVLMIAFPQKCSTWNILIKVFHAERFFPDPAWGWTRIMAESSDKGNIMQF